MAETPNLIKSSLVRKNYTSLDYGKLPPQAVDLEGSVLGALMISPKSILEVEGFLTPATFYKDQHQKIYKAIQTLRNDRNPIDILTVVEQLKKNRELDLAGGAFYVNQLTTQVGSSANIEYHARVLHEKFMAREIISASTELIKIAYEDTSDVIEIMESGNKRWEQLQRLSVAGQVKGLASTVKEAATRIWESIIKGKNHKDFLSKHSVINEVWGGYAPGTINVIAARTGMGKTAFHISELLHMVKSGVKCASVNLEMMEHQFILRAFCNLSGIPNYRAKHNDFREGEHEAWAQAEEWLSAQEELLYLEFEAGLDIVELCNRLRRRHAENGLEVIFIDHLQFIRNTTAKFGTNDLEIGDTMRRLKQLAKELKCAIILFCHVNRSSETNDDKWPQMKDLRGSGNIENDSDTISFLLRPEAYLQKDPYGRTIFKSAEQEAMKGICKVRCAKNRDGMTFETEWRCNLGTSDFRDIETAAPVAAQMEIKGFVRIDSPAEGQKQADDDLPF